VLLQAALNGAHTKAAHPALPLSVQELVRDAVACVAAGAGAIHLHPRDAEGHERLEASVSDVVVGAARAACGVPVGVSTGAWIEPDLQRRIALVRTWRAPDYASVNLSEPGALEMMETLLEIGIGIEAGVWTVADAELLGTSGLGECVARILIEAGELQVRENAADALRLVEDIHRTLDRFGLTVPRLQHGDGKVTWVILADAVRRGIDTRVGLEDTADGPSGERTTGNEALVRAARALGAGVTSASTTRET
jgi:uncharacterized protein (DUF849 family)